MKNIFFSFVLLLLAACQTLGEVAFAAGGAAIGAIGGPATAAVGAGVGILVADTFIPSKAESIVSAIAGDQPVGGTASTIHEVHELVSSVGWWYLLLFVLAPLLTKRGRNWIANFTKLHNAVSKKDVELQLERLNRLEGLLPSPQNKE
jgi:hypothetical protein